MSSAALLVLRIVLGLMVLGALGFQVVLIAGAFLAGPEPLRPMNPFVLAGVLVLVLASMQLIGISFARLLGALRDGPTVSSLRQLDLITLGFAICAVMFFVIAVLGALNNRMVPGDEIAPGVVAIICAISGALGATAGLVATTRRLLGRAIA